MGVEYGFYKVTRYGNITFDDFFNVKNYLEWKNNSWARENFSSYKKYWETFCKEEGTKYPGEPAEDVAEYYASHKEDDLGYDIEKCLGFWCSIGIEIDKVIRDWLKMGYNEYHKQIDKEFVDKALEYAETELEHNRLIPMTVVSKIGEVELESEFGELLKVNLEGRKIYLETDKYDSDERYMLKVLRDTMYVVKQVDFDNNFVWYSRSW